MYLSVLVYLNSNVITVPVLYTKLLFANSNPIHQASPETSSRTVNANDKSWCFSTQFGFGCLDLAFLNNCWVKTLTGRKDTPIPVIGICRPGATLRRPLLIPSPLNCSRGLWMPQDIQDHYEAYNGFVILHGTDTMAFTGNNSNFESHYFWVLFKVRFSCFFKVKKCYLMIFSPVKYIGNPALI